MSKFFKVLSDSILILTIIVLSLYFVLRIANVIRIYNVETGSMEDKIHASDYILLLKKSNYYVGDVVTYRVNDYFITHRIVRIEGDQITTKGDANNTEDLRININQIEGKAIYWGGILNFIINYKFVVVAFLIGVYLLSCYFENDKESESKKEKKKILFENIEAETSEKEITNIVDTKEDVKEEVIEKPLAIIGETVKELDETKVVETKTTDKKPIEKNKTESKPKTKKTSSKKTTSKTKKSTTGNKAKTKKTPSKKKKTAGKTTTKKTSTKKSK